MQCYTCTHISNKERFLPNNNRVNTTVWMHHTDANETHVEKAR